ncbi:sialate O-acetylesterase [Niabella yanshanensis]|uniref:Sialate O-acetylesterase n=1 Tax=Niabella yanshanensis TaxID=577386 RepID=A0ABZ0W6Z0_9BACT|nr:sialate O-acetylesterase [Niabella yanshanensis]WQD38709.1 sialate O-acetylesterase [Niabella yanshanensis]
MFRFLLGGLFLLISVPILSQVKLPRIIRDSMVLQRNTKINIWGWASTREKVTVRFNHKTYRATTDHSGKWTIQLASTPSGGPYRMEISGKNKIILNHILVGEVWLFSGQSNMEHMMRQHDIIYANEILTAGNPNIRQFKIPNVTSMVQPQADLPGGSWKDVNPANVMDFSAVAYFFAEKIAASHNVPVGIINATWGGTPIEAWTSEKGFANFPGQLSIITKNKDTVYLNNLRRKPGNNNGGLLAKRPTDKGQDEKWYDLSYQPKGWRNMAVPGYWEDQGVKNLDGIIWFRKELDIPASMTGKPAKMFLGRIVDADECYLNGVRIGATSYMYPQRRYPVAGGLLREGKNVLVVRVTNNGGKGGFVPDKPYQLIAGNDTVELTGYWKYKVGQVFTPLRGRGGSGGSIVANSQPAAIFNAMLAPVIPFSVKGFAWYQGESNTGKPQEYAQIQPAMIKDWRNQWQLPDAPFLFVQLPGFMDYSYVPGESGWAMFREAQARSLTVPNTAMAVTIDLGEWNDIHPDRKKEVGERLALAAEKMAYKKDIVYTGPTLQSSVKDGNKIMLTFSNTGGGLITHDGEPVSEFAIAGADKKFVWAKAVIDGNRIIVSSEEITDPKYVRYAWADNPVNPNLFNKEGLPAAPFRTDAD